MHPALYCILHVPIIDQLGMLPFVENAPANLRSKPEHALLISDHVPMMLILV